ncbi:hypothetical protein F5B22DRAFT_649635 [Xylaria bambusicola]|uniref:uncharacterized protein n=1 Tax=Xylaria bambusicola TaxID=326684 RepID=UPI00200770FB|nr:uncharacterized protein F5B22DRAFT_649635 [Xylaria bambusicola]KAI0508739.1 hypothetical protein F5B22DRAFT_649635 [Xylaria bambusicola]
MQRYHEIQLLGKSQWATWQPIKEHPSTDIKPIFVEGHQENTSGDTEQRRPNFCLITIGETGGIMSLASIVKAHLKSNQAYQATLQDLRSTHEKEKGPVLYNTPLSYRELTDKEYDYLNTWIVELQDRENDNKIREACNKGLYNFLRRADSQGEETDSRKRKR